MGKPGVTDQTTGDARGLRLGQQYRGEACMALASGGRPRAARRSSGNCGVLGVIAASAAAPAAQQQGIPSAWAAGFGSD